MANSIMLQGTGSSVGKSILTAALCRILKEDGVSVAPFKSQNMALNSFITKDGMEMGRAQVVQAEAAGIEPDVLMNPILLKPTADTKCQVIVNGKVDSNKSAMEYHLYKKHLKNVVKDTYDTLASKYDAIVLEGAGSPAEINLREHDLVNMGMAEIADCPVVIVGDIDKGGVFASLYGTIMLLTEEERKRVKGVIINKFRGDKEILKPGIEMLEDLIKIPVLGVVPYMNVQIEDEDSLAEKFKRKAVEGASVQVEVLYLPHVSNFTDFDVFHTQEDVNVRYVMRGEDIGDPDLLIIPGSKNTIEDLIYLRNTGLEKQIINLKRRGKIIAGICGGFQILGKRIHDPHHTETAIESINGLGILDVETVFDVEKTTTQVEGKIICDEGYYKEFENQNVYGYEIHMGETKLLNNAKPFTMITKSLDEEVAIEEGAYEGNVFGTYIHGVFDNIEFTRGLINKIRKDKGLDEVNSNVNSFEDFKEREYTKLAKLVRANLEMDKVYKVINGEI